MIRWSYVVPRLLLVGTIVLALWFGLNPLVRWAVVSAGQSAISAKVEIGRVDTSLWNAELRLADVRVANPQAPMQNLFEASEVKLRLDPDALSRRKLVVREGRASGLRFGTDRDISGAVDADWGLDLPRVELPELDEKWLDQLAGLLRQQLMEQAEQLESVRLAKELIERWPAEYKQMEERAEQVRWRIDNLRQLSQVSGDNPVQVFDSCQHAVAEVREIQREIAELRSEVDRLHEQARMDKEAIAQARKRDLRRIQETLRPENLNAETLSRYFLGPDLSDKVLAVAKWVQWGRKHLPGKVDASQPARRRGMDVLFDGARKRPDFLIESLVIDGEAELGRRQFAFIAAAGGITSDAKLYGRPVVLKARINAQTPLAVEAVLDRTGETPHDRVTINCPAIKQPERVLGRPGKLALAVSPGTTHLWASLDLEGDILSGQILVKQGPVELTPELPASFGGDRLAANLQTAMAEFRELRAVVELGGTLEKPRWELESNLGPQLAAALDGLVERELDARRQELIAYLEGQIEDQLAQLEQTIVAKRGKLLAKLDVDGNHVQALDRVIAQRLRLPQAALGQGLPAAIPWRF